VTRRKKEEKISDWKLSTSGQKEEIRARQRSRDRDYRCFFASARYRVVKITCSCSEVILQTMKTIKQTIVYPGSGPFYKVIALRPAFLCIEDE
jgi:hypothetical protein